MLIGLAVPMPVAAEVVATTGGFTVTHVRSVAADAAASWSVLIDWGRWWSSGHSWSGEASNIRLDATAGGCLCERWSGGEVEHGRVMTAIPGKLLRLDAPFGPLQALPVTARLSFKIRPADSGTVIALELRVDGQAAAGLGAPVDAVLRDAADRLAGRIATLQR